MQILVIGMHRAGTSATARLVNMMGAWFGPEGMSLGFARDNPKGFWERKDVLHINQSLMKHFGAVWYKLGGWDASRFDSLPKPLVRAIRSTILEMDAHRPWLLKDPRLCLTLPAWLPWLEVPVAVISTRHPLEIARSLQMRNGMPVEYALALWEHYAVHAIRNTHDLPRIFSSYEALLAQPLKCVHTLYEELLVHGVQGLRMPSEREILAFIEPSLQRAKKADTDHKLTEEQKTLHAILSGEAMFDPKVEVSAQARHIMAAAGFEITGTPADS